MKDHTRFGFVATVILVLLTVISLSGCGGVTYKTYTNTKYKFSLEHPSDMVVKGENEAVGNATTAVDLEGKAYVASVGIWEAKGNQSSEAATLKNSVESMTPKATNIKDETTTMGGQPAFQISYTSDVSGTKYFTEDALTVNDGKVYELGVVCPSTDYLKATDPFNKMKESFKFL